MLIWSLLSMFGFGIVVRTLQTYEHLNLFPQKHIKWTRNIAFMSIFFLNYMFRQHPIALWVFQFVIFLSPWWLATFVQAYREKIIQNQMIPILDSLIISMRSGASLRSAVERYTDHCDPTAQLALKEFLVSLQYKKDREMMANSAKIRQFLDELQDIDDLQHKQIERLRAFKRRLMTERNFRQKSSQATIQIKAQAWIMTGMFSFLLVYISSEFGFYKNLPLIFFATVIFLAGLILVLRMGKSYVWKL